MNAHAHYITTDPSNRFVLASISGADFLAVYPFDATTGHLARDPVRVNRPPSANPRHMDFHPNGQFLYLINEHSSTVTAYRFDGTTGSLTELQDLSTLPAGYAGAAANSTAQLLVHPSGKFLYGSNRGHDSIVIYGIDQATGRLTLIGFQTDVGRRPRNFTIDPGGTNLFVAAQDDGTVSTYRIEPNGTLVRRGPPLPAGDRPTFVGVLVLPGT
jgi:6-phosphogluconolactonase